MVAEQSEASVYQFTSLPVSDPVCSILKLLLFSVDPKLEIRRLIAHAILENGDAMVLSAEKELLHKPLSTSKCIYFIVEVEF